MPLKIIGITHSTVGNWGYKSNICELGFVIGSVLGGRRAPGFWVEDGRLWGSYQMALMNGMSLHCFACSGWYRTRCRVGSVGLDSLGNHKTFWILGFWLRVRCGETSRSWLQHFTQI